MTRRSARGFTLVELLVVIAIIGIFIAMMLPAVQAAREAARKMQCTNNLGQLGLALSNYANASGHLPAGTQADSGPIESVEGGGYHHGWIGQILPYLDQQNAFSKTDFEVDVYDEKNAPVRALTLPVLICPSADGLRISVSHYAGVHHHVEAPIDTDNSGVLFLNSAVRYDDISDGSAHTLFLGEKLAVKGDLGWMSGTRAILRNTGGGINQQHKQTPTPNQPVAPPSPTAVGGFGSGHSGGAMFSLGDGSVRFVANETNQQVLEQMAQRADGQLIDIVP